MAHFDATERCGLAVPYVASPLDLAAMERDGDVEYLDLDRYAHPARADAEARERGEDDVEKDRNRTAARAKTRKNRAAAAAAAGGQLRALAAACSDELGALDGVDGSAVSGGSNDGTAAYVAVERRERPSDADDADDAKKRAKTSPPAPPPPPPPKETDEVVALRDDVARLASVVTYMAHAMSGMRWEIDSLRRRDIDRSRVEAEDERGKEKESDSPENNAAVAAAVEDAAKSLRAILAL